MVRIPVFIVVIASFVTILQMVMQAYVPDVYAELGLFIPLIVVNCVILGRAEAFAAKNSTGASLMDGIKVFRKCLVRPRLQHYSVVYEDGSLSNGWV